MAVSYISDGPLRMGNRGGIQSAWPEVLGNEVLK
jgi:hypothetical protein